MGWHLAPSLRALGQGWNACSGPPSPALGSEALVQVPMLLEADFAENSRRLLMSGKLCKKVALSKFSRK